MVPVLTNEIHDLGIDEAVSFVRVFEYTVRGIEGYLWLTQEGVPEDVVLAPGDCCTIRTKGRVAMEALDGRARFAVSQRENHAQSWRDSWRVFWARVFVKRQTFDCR